MSVKQKKNWEAWECSPCVFRFFFFSGKKIETLTSAIELNASINVKRKYFLRMKNCALSSTTTFIYPLFLIVQIKNKVEEKVSKNIFVRLYIEKSMYINNTLTLAYCDTLSIDSQFFQMRFTPPHSSHPFLFIQLDEVTFFFFANCVAIFLSIMRRVCFEVTFDLFMRIVIMRSVDFFAYNYALFFFKCKFVK